MALGCVERIVFVAASSQGPFDVLLKSVFVPFVACPTDTFMVAPPSDFNNGDCYPLTNCTADEFALIPATSTSDRFCDTLTQCTIDQFQSLAPTPDSDRVCVNTTQCGLGEFEVAPLTPTSDRQCGTNSTATTSTTTTTTTTTTKTTSECQTPLLCAIKCSADKITSLSSSLIPGACPGCQCTPCESVTLASCAALCSPFTPVVRLNAVSGCGLCQCSTSSR
jgi:hypothetical protein